MTMESIPLWIRKFALDFLETTLGVLLTLNLVVPGDMTTAKAQALVVGAAVLGALVSAVRRAAPQFIAWVAGKLGTGAA